MAEIKAGDFVVANCHIGEGIVKNAVGLIHASYNQTVIVYFIGKDKEVHIHPDCLDIINVDKTGDEYTYKICNVCHLRKLTRFFSVNQRNKNRLVRRPSCKECRKIIDGQNLTSSEKNRMYSIRPDTKTVFVCPVCKKRTITDVTAKIVIDHDHNTGMGRKWICDSCNTGLGRFKDDPVLLQRAIKYLESF